MLLLPSPTSLQLLGHHIPLDPAANHTVRVTRVGRGLPENTIAGQAYTLETGDPAATGALFHITCASDAGRRYALATAQQLLRQHTTHIPALRIVDEPAFATRGVMLDVSRDRVPSMPFLLSVVELLASLKINHLQLYTEHTFAYAGHEAAWRGWSPFTPDEIRTLDAHCRTHGIELAANQNTFGHLAHWLRLPQYAHLAETHGDWVFDVWPRSGPFSLCPTDPASLAFVKDLLDQLLPAFTSPLVNIGCDETYDVGFGRSREAVAARGRHAVYAEFVSRVCSLVRARAKRPMFWADIALHHPATLDQLPDDLIAIAWGYEPDSKFDEWAHEITSRKRELWLAPGTSSWRSITGRTSERYVNLARAAESGVAHRATGYLICDWGDTGHHQTWPISLHAIAHGCHAAWNAGAAADLDPRAISLHAFDDESLAISTFLDELGDADVHLRNTCGRLARPDLDPAQPHRLRNQSALFIDTHNHPHDAHTDIGTPDDWRRAAATIDTLSARRPRHSASLLNDELDHTLAVARFAAKRALLRRSNPTPGLTTSQRAELAESLRAIMTEHARLWHARSRPGGLDHSLSFYQKVLADLTR